LIFAAMREISRAIHRQDWDEAADLLRAAGVPASVIDEFLEFEIAHASSLPYPPGRRRV